MFFAEARRSVGSAKTAAAMSARERPAPASRAMMASGLEAERRRDREISLLDSLDKLRNAFLDTSHAWAGARPQDAMR